MGMSKSVCGFRPPDAKFMKMKAVYDACKAAGVDTPDEVEGFFDGDEPDENGVEINENDLVKAGAVREWDNGIWASGYEVLIDKLPPGVKVIRFSNNW